MKVSVSATIDTVSAQELMLMVAYDPCLYHSKINISCPFVHIQSFGVGWIGNCEELLVILS